MDEKQKMLSGELYSANDDVLIKERYEAKDLCHRFNSTKPSNIEEMMKVNRIFVILLNLYIFDYLSNAF